MCMSKCLCCYRPYTRARGVSVQVYREGTEMYRGSLLYYTYVFTPHMSLLHICLYYTYVFTSVPRGCGDMYRGSLLARRWLHCSLACQGVEPGRREVRRGGV